MNVNRPTPGPVAGPNMTPTGASPSADSSSQLGHASSAHRRGAGARSAPSLPWVVSAAFLFLLTAGASAVSIRQLELHMAELDGQSLVEAEDAFGSLVDQERNHLLASARLLAEDTRIRSTTMTTGFDEGTIRDVLDDLKASSNASAMAVLDASGKVRAVTGADGLRQVDLGSSPVIEAAQKEPASYFWTLPDRLLLIAVAPIRSGPRVTAFLLLGAALGPTELGNITRSLEVAGAIFAGDRLIAAGSRDPVTVELLERANTFADGASHIVRGPYEALSRVTRTGGTATAARVAWLVKVHRQSARARIIRTASVIPAVLTAVFLVGIALSKLRTLKGGRS